jgi:hypothetical protein
MRPSRRFLLAGLGVAAGEATLGVLTLPTILAPYFWVCALATVAVTLGVRRLVDPGDDGGDPGGGDDGGAGPDDPGSAPWWPAFEDAFRAHAGERSPDEGGVLTSVGPRA